jgi:hypothetical protein
MSHRITRIGAAAMLAALSASAQRAEASSHRESLAIIHDPCVDSTDIYAWVTPTSHDKLYLIAGYYGLHEPGQGNHQTKLCDNVLYEFHITKGTGMIQNDLTYQIVFSSTPPTPVDAGDLALGVGGGKELLIQLSGSQQTYSVFKVEGADPATRTRTVIGRNIPVTPTNIGPRTDRIAYGLGNGFDINNPEHSSVGLYDDAFAATFIKPLGPNGNGDGSEGRAWAGTRDDGFYLDEKGIFDILNLTGLPRTSPGEDVFAGFNLNVIALEIPISKVIGAATPPHNGTPGNDTMIGVWTTASRRKITVRFNDGNDINYGPWVQVNRQALPLVNAGLIGAQDQPRFLRTHPRDDVANFGVYFLNPILVRDLEAIGAYAALGVDQNTIDSLKSGRTDILKTINLDDIPTAGAHNVQIAAGVTGDVIRLDVATDSQFPNGRSLQGSVSNKEQVDVSDVLITVICSGGAIPLGDGVNSNDKEYLTVFPFLPLPHQGLFEGHGAVAP